MNRPRPATGMATHRQKGREVMDLQHPVFAFSMLFTSGARPAVGQAVTQPNSQNLRCMEGVYAVEEFKRDGEVFRPPQVSGRLMLLNGAVFWIFHDRTQQSKQISSAAFGRYTISETAYAYRYDDYTVYTHTDTGTSVTRQPPWEGMRQFTPVLEPDGMRLRTADAQQDFLCLADGGLLYTFRQGDFRNYRKYRRIRSE